MFVFSLNFGKVYLSVLILVLLSVQLIIHRRMGLLNVIIDRLSRYFGVILLLSRRSGVSFCLSQILL